MLIFRACKTFSSFKSCFCDNYLPCGVVNLIFIDTLKLNSQRCRSFKVSLLALISFIKYASLMITNTVHFWSDRFQKLQVILHRLNENHPS